MEDKNPVGRPEITEEEKNDIVSKLEPYLKSGLNISKALREVEVPRATFYKLMDRDEQFRDKINHFRQFLSVVFNNAVVKQLRTIIDKQNAGKLLDKLDLRFLTWFANNSNLTKEEFGKREDIGLYDPEIEIHRLLGIIKGASKEAKEDETPK